MKIALVDDEPMCLEEMTKLCHDFGAQHHCQIETFSFTSGEAFLDAFAAEAFSVVFMDIYMEEMNGIDAALRMRGLDHRCFLIFLTSSTDFMPDAFSCHAFDYVTKPFSPRRIQDVLTDVLKTLSPPQKYLEVISGRKTMRLLFDEITSVITDAHYLNIELADGTTLRSRMTMPAFMKQVETDDRFILINKGIAVNADYILEFENNCCLLTSGTRFPIRVRDRLKIEQAARDYHFEKIRRRQKIRKPEENES